MSGYLPPPANAPLPPLDPSYRKVITEALSRVPRDFTPRDALSRLDGHLGIWGVDWRSMYEDYSHTGIFDRPPLTATPALRTQPAAASSGSSAASQQPSHTQVNPVTRENRPMTSARRVGRGMGPASHPAASPAEAAPRRPQTRSQTAGGPAPTHRPASAAPAPRLRQITKDSKPYSRSATPATSAPSFRATYTKVIKSDVSALAKFRLLTGKERKDWGRFLAEMAPRLGDRRRFWQKANQTHNEDILKCMAKLTAEEAAARARPDR